MIRSSSPSSFSSVTLLAIALVACASRSAKGPQFVTAPELVEAPRRPDGVVVDPSTELPEAINAAEPAAPLVALEPPLPEKAARSVIASYFKAIVTEDLEALGELVTSEAGTTSKSRGVSPGIVDLWRARMRHFRYRTLANDVLYQETDLELYRYDDLDAVATGRPLRPAEMARSDWLVKVPMLVVHTGTERAFGEDVTFLLRREKSRFRIRQIFEDFQIP